MGNLVVSEKFYSIQGEGMTMGVPAVFLRLSGCNILCKGEHWVCDTIEVWKKGVKTKFKDVLKEYIKQLSQGAHLVITGGEPMLHQKKLEEYIEWFKNEYKFKPIIEVETNGTILPKEYFFKNVDFWNCSPKLSTSGEHFGRRYKEVPLKRLNESDNTIFKFVISTEADVDEMVKDFGHLDYGKFILMPAGDSQIELNKTRVMVLEQCMKMNLRYCDRLHIVGWDQKTGV